MKETLTFNCSGKRKETKSNKSYNSIRNKNAVYLKVSLII